ncbi:hypothetical protein I547_5334 [Mycobacterium kansasii 824]|nr:hypothetical protein I547_5334 [Mycobacterium kansasii 824]
MFGVHHESGGLGAQRVAQHVDPEQPPTEHRAHSDDERIGRNGECQAGFADPRRFIAVTSTMALTAKNTLCSYTKGIAEPMFDIADAIETATVRT